MLNIMWKVARWIIITAVVALLVWAAAMLWKKYSPRSFKKVYAVVVNFIEKLKKAYA